MNLNCCVIDKYLSRVTGKIRNNIQLKSVVIYVVIDLRTVEMNAETVHYTADLLLASGNNYTRETGLIAIKTQPVIPSVST